MVANPKKILILPDAGPANPFQYLLIDYLKQCGFTVAKERAKRFFTVFPAMRKHQPDILYFDWIQSFILGRTLLVTLLKCVCFCLEIGYVKWVRRTRIVHTLHNIQNHAGRWVKAERAVYGWFLRRCDKIRVYSDTTRHKVAGIYNLDPQRILVIQDVPYHYYYPNVVSRRESRARFSIPEDAVVYVFLGMVKPYKGLENLLTAFAEVESKETYLIIAGASDQKSYEENLARRVASQPKITYHNHFIDPQQVQYYYQAADVVVLPFRNVEHSGSVDLALSFGKPVITVNTPFFSSLLAHQRALLFNDAHELADRLRNAPWMDLDAIGQANFRLADSVNYKQLVQLFA